MISVKMLAQILTAWPAHFGTLLSNQSLGLPKGPDPLAELRDIQLPAPISWWPPAPGWWILMFTIITALFYCLFRIYRRRRNGLYRRQALSELESFYTDNKTNPNLFSHQVLALLRRTARVAYPEKQLDALPTKKLLETISVNTPGSSLHRNLQVHLSEAPYQASPQYPINFSEEVFVAVKQWIKNHPEAMHANF